MPQTSALHISTTLATQASSLRSEAAQMSYRHSRNDIFAEAHALEDLVESLDSLNEHKFPNLAKEIQSSLPDDLDALATSICNSLQAAEANFRVTHAHLRRPFRSTFSGTLVHLMNQAHTLQKACKDLDDELCPLAPEYASNPEAWAREEDDEDASSDSTSTNTSSPPPTDRAAYREQLHYPNGFERIAYMQYMSADREVEATISASSFDAYMAYTTDATNTDCNICFSALAEVSSVAVTDCGHVFCGQCIDHAIRRQRRCPMCRAECVRCRMFGKKIEGLVY